MLPIALRMYVLCKATKGYLGNEASFNVWDDKLGFLQKGLNKDLKGFSNMKHTTRQAVTQLHLNIRASLHNGQSYGLSRLNNTPPTLLRVQP